MVTLHEVITFLVSMQISIAACRPIMSIDVVEVVIWRESSVSGGSGAVQMFLRWQQRNPLSAADLPPSPTKSSNLSETAEVPACNVPSRSPLPALAIAPETKLGTASSGLGTLEP